MYSVITCVCVGRRCVLALCVDLTKCAVRDERRRACKGVLRSRNRALFVALASLQCGARSSAVVARAERFRVVCGAVCVQNFCRGQLWMVRVIVPSDGFCKLLRLFIVVLNPNP